jgi:hypothetical protein
MAEKTNWVGTVWGTNRGTLIAEFNHERDQVDGKIQLFEPGLGHAEIHVIGQWSDAGKISATLNQFVGHYMVPVVLPQSGTMEGQYDPAADIILGEWKTDAGTTGKFILAKSQTPQWPAGAVQHAPQATLPSVPAGTATAPSAQAPVEESLPPQIPPPLVTKTQVLGSYRLDLDGLRRLAELVRSGTNVVIPVINAALDGREFIHVGVDSLLADPSVPAIIHDVRIAANEPVIRAGNNTCVVTLKKDQPNTLYVSGYDRVWVEGKATQIEHFLEYHETKATHFLRKFGSTLNTIIFLLMLAFLPSVPSLTNRLKVVGAVFALLLLLHYSWRLAANTKVFLREPQIAWYERNAGWLLVLLEVALASWIAYLTQKYTHP